MAAKYTLLQIDWPLSSVALVTLNRPEAANALSGALAGELELCFTELADEPKLRAIILTGKGDKAFCAGADLKERKGMSEAQWHEQHDRFENATAALRAMHVPVVAAVGGAAVGGGLELALACDFIIASNHARFALTETSLGIMPGLGGTQYLPRAVGLRRAKELIFSASSFSADEALQWGLVNHVVHPADLMKKAVEIAGKIANNAPLAVRHAKLAVEEGCTLPIDAALALELSYYKRLLNSEDRYEGVNAFNEKRAPEFKGK